MISSVKFCILLSWLLQFLLFIQIEQIKSDRVWINSGLEQKEGNCRYLQDMLCETGVSSRSTLTQDVGMCGEVDTVEYPTEANETLV